MANEDNNRICPVERADGFDSGIRRWLYPPQKIVGSYLEEGMTVLDIGCGPGFFSIDMAQMIGQSGRVIACDLQEGMLQKLKGKIQGTKFEERITLHKCEVNKVGVSESVDFVLLFYVAHEIPDKEALFNEIGTILKPKGQVLMVEPPVHVSKKVFEDAIRVACDTGFIVVNRPKVLLSKAVVLSKG
ncbi:class I SAM-dependent methyltransferase [bacterium]|nr:class I SAM-dependent methyltransferase [bacterium]